ARPGSGFLRDSQRARGLYPRRTRDARACLARHRLRLQQVRCRVISRRSWILATDNPPTGMGEIGVVTVAPAIAGALFQLTGKRIRHVPMTAERVKAVLNA